MAEAYLVVEIGDGEGAGEVRLGRHRKDWRTAGTPARHDRMTGLELGSLRRLRCWDDEAEAVKLCVAVDCLLLAGWRAEWQRGS